MSPISASMTSAVNWPTPGSVVRVLTRGPALACWRSSPSIRPVTGARPSITARQPATTSRDTGGRPRPGQPAAAGPGQVATGPVEAEIGHHRVDPVALLGAQPAQPGPVPQQGAELPDLWRGDPRPRAAAARAAAAPGRGGSTLRGAVPRAATGPASWRRPLSFFSRAEAIALHRS